MSPVVGATPKTAGGVVPKMTGSAAPEDTGVSCDPAGKGCTPVTTLASRVEECWRVTGHEGRLALGFVLNEHPCHPLKVDLLMILKALLLLARNNAKFTKD
ncbi:hypothetical protein Tsubulata_003006 [Turnera subulata]|uniref:Uncharacterized protein n=1 Tax=Turnera subulata TaxID=218843 RepID=A0A9Q0G1W7_9ROSI|nr:hypothetical protein Tsubulata_003006 [Turnera subulata]